MATVQLTSMKVDLAAVVGSASHNGRLHLSEADRKNLDDFDRLRRIIKARVNGVARRKHVGAYLSGRTGTSKTVTVIETLDEQHINYQYLNCRVSPGGLYDAMKQNPEAVLVLDDVSTLYKHPQGLQVLLAALNGKPNEPRKVSYVLKGEQGEPPFDFWGGVIGIANRPLQRDPVADAVASRVRPVEHEPSNDMIASFMRSQALNGFEEMPPEKCWEVVEYVIELSKRNEYRLDLRHMEQGWQDYRLWQHGESFEIHWKVLISSSMHQTAKEDEFLDSPLTKSEEVFLDREKVRRAVEKFPGDRQQQITSTGLTTRTFDRRVKELKRLGLLPDCQIARLPVHSRKEQTNGRKT
jgi:hypothetical protein